MAAAAERVREKPETVDKTPPRATPPRVDLKRDELRKLVLLPSIRRFLERLIDAQEREQARR